MLESKELFWIKKALRNCSFYELEEENFEQDVFNPFVAEYGNAVDYSSGATKGVLIFKDFDFVIKIPYTHCEGNLLEGAYEACDRWNYCEQEIIRYNKAKENNFEKMFLEIVLLDYINGHPIYIQKFAKSFDEIDIDKQIPSHTDNEYKIVKEIAKEYDYSCIEPYWEADILGIYGEIFYHNFMNFITENNLDDDLREVNIGYVDKKPVIIDYAGFNY